MPNNGPWQQPQSLKKGWKEWAAPSATDALTAADAPAAADTGFPGSQDIEENPRQLSIIGNLKPDQKIHRQTPTREVGWMLTSTSSCPS